jgi:hypothetical protein
MSTRFYMVYIVGVLCLVWGVELVLGSLYARYIIIYTGGVFLAGLVIGQRYEQAWLNRQNDPSQLGGDGRRYQSSSRAVMADSGEEGAAL